MGQQSSSISHQLLKYRFPKQQYTKIGSQTWQHNQDQFDQLKQAKIFLCNQQAIQSFQKIYHIRKASDFLVRAIYFDLEEDKQVCSSKKVGTLYIESDQLRLSDITDIPFPDCLHLYYQSLRGFQQLFEEYGAFGPQQEHFCINTRSQLKVWHNSNLHCNSVEHPMAPTSQTQMLRQVLHILKRNSDGIRSKDRQNLQHNLQTAHTFKAAIQVFNSWCKIQNARVPPNLACVEKHGLIVHNLAEQSRLSKKFDLFEQVNKKLRRGDDMKIPQVRQNNQQIQVRQLASRLLLLQNNIVYNNSTQVNPINPVKPSSAVSLTINYPPQNKSLNRQRANFTQSYNPLLHSAQLNPVQLSKPLFKVNATPNSQINDNYSNMKQIRNYHMNLPLKANKRQLVQRQLQVGQISFGKYDTNQTFNTKNKQINNFQGKYLQNRQPSLELKDKYIDTYNINSKSVSPCIIGKNQKSKDLHSLSPYSGPKTQLTKVNVQTKKINEGINQYRQNKKEINSKLISFNACQQKNQPFSGQLLKKIQMPNFSKSQVYPGSFHQIVNQGLNQQSSGHFQNNNKPIVPRQNDPKNFIDGYRRQGRYKNLHKQQKYESLESRIDEQLYADLQKINQRVLN